MNIKKIFLIVAATLFYATSQAQDKVSDTISIGKTDATDAIIEKIGEQAIELKSLKTREQQLLDSIAGLNKQLVEKEVLIKSERENKMKVEDEKNSLKIKYDGLVKEFSTLDAIVYKQCLLYPLEGRYNENLINEALRAAHSFANLSPQKSAEFNECMKTYEPLLHQYEKYNEEIMNFIKDKEQYLITKMTFRKIKTITVDEGDRTNFINELKGLTYYQKCYIHRNDPPYKSILYLDEAIDKFKAIINEKGDVSKKFNDLIKSLEPKQKTAEL